MDQNMHYSRIMKSWEEFIETGKINGNHMHTYIANSWIRSRAYGIDPYTSNYISQKDIKEVIKNSEQLYRIGVPYLKLVYNFVNGSGFVVMLVDAEGYVMEVIGDHDMMKTAERNLLIPGANRSERFAGTNATSLALIENIPLQVFGPEHYNYNFHNWTCSSAPIKNNEGETIGVFNLSGHYSLVHKHTLGLVASVVKSIEREFNLNEAHKKLLIANENLETVINSVNDGLLAIDRNGAILKANPKAMVILGKGKLSLEGMQINRLFDVTFCTEAMEVIATGKGFVDREFNLKTGEGNNYCLMTVKTNKGPSGEVVGALIIIRERQKIHNLVHRIVGANANFSFDDILGKDKTLVECINMAKTIARTDTKVLLEGESGTGKELFAQAIHNFSNRKNGPFIAVNCSAIPRELIESELFGYEEGAFSGAKKRGKPGRFELAEGGTLFLDEVSSMSLDMQAKLLRVIQENMVMRLGGVNNIVLDTRIIAATNRELNELIREGSFREDLFYRLSVVTIRIPPLRKRRKDIPILINHFNRHFCNKFGFELGKFLPETMGMLVEYDWPGNVRELENIVERAIVLSGGGEIGKELLPDKITATVKKIFINNHVHSLEDLEINTIKKALENNMGNIMKTAKELGVSRNTIYNKLRKWD